MDEHQEPKIPEATTPGEINTHLGYLRRDIYNLTKSTSEQLKGIREQITNLDDHYITESEFRPVADTVKQQTVDIKSLTEWKDTFNGKMIGFGIGISLMTSLLTLLITYLLKK